MIIYHLWNTNSLKIICKKVSGKVLTHHRYNKQTLDCRYTQQMIECYYQGLLIATHQRSYKKRYTTIKAHMPKSHQAQAEWTQERLIRWAKEAGAATEQFIEAMIESRPHPEQAFRACLGVMRLGQRYGNARLEKAANRALHVGAYSYHSIASILKKNLDRRPLPKAPKASATVSLMHQNIRGPHYYH